MNATGLEGAKRKKKKRKEKKGDQWACALRCAADFDVDMWDVTVESYLWMIKILEYNHF